jgi:ATP-dependent RNA helicase DHX57
LHPEAGLASCLFSEDVPKVIEELGQLGFTDAQCLKAVTFLSQFSPLASNLRRTLPALEAAIEYLTLYVPRRELPQRFLPSTNSSSSITSAHLSGDDLRRHRIEDKAIKEAYWPAHVVKDLTANSNLFSWDCLMAALGKRLIGDGPSEDDANSDPYIIDADEVEVLGGFYVDPTELVIPLPNAQIQIHVLISPDSYPRSSYAPMYITSTMVPPYICLHLLSRVLIAIKSNSLVDAEEGFCRAVTRCLEGEWAKIGYHGPPTPSVVLRHLVPNPKAYPETCPSNGFDLTPKRTTQRHWGHRRDDRHNNEIRNDFKALCRSDKVS